MNHSKKCGEVFEKRNCSHITAAVSTSDNTLLLCTEFLLAIVRLVRKLGCCSTQKGYYVCFSYNPTIIFSHRCLLWPWHLFFTDLVNICTEHEPVLSGLSEAQMKFFLQNFPKTRKLTLPDNDANMSQGSWLHVWAKASQFFHWSCHCISILQKLHHCDELIILIAQTQNNAPMKLKLKPLTQTIGM